LKLSQISNLESTHKISDPYLNMAYANENTKLELHHLQFNDMQSYDIENKK
jgi:hypothetical protein